MTKNEESKRVVLPRERKKRQRERERERESFSSLLCNQQVPGALYTDLSDSPILGLSCKRLQKLRKRKWGKEEGGAETLNRVSLLRKRIAPPPQTKIPSAFTHPFPLR
jgi:hypothetical protein